MLARRCKGLKGPYKGVCSNTFRGCFMVYLFRAQAGEKIPYSFDSKIDGIIERFDPNNPLASEGEYEEYIEWSINPLPGVTLEQAATVFNAIWAMSGEIDPDVAARIFEK